VRTDQACAPGDQRTASGRHAVTLTLTS
jgi:hypothetical protein